MWSSQRGDVMSTDSEGNTGLGEVEDTGVLEEEVFSRELYFVKKFTHIHF